MITDIKEIENTLKSYGKLPKDQRDYRLAVFKNNNKDTIKLIKKLNQIFSVDEVKNREMTYE